jgi:flagellar hook-length control protein FliK
VTRARIALRPEELGGVEVHLRHTAEGLTARVVAEAPEAAHLLGQAAGELLRSFEQQGITLLRFDVGTAAEHGPGAGAAGHERRDGRRRESTADDALPTDTTTVEHTIELSNGTLVDVLA